MKDDQITLLMSETGLEDSTWVEYGRGAGGWLAYSSVLVLELKETGEYERREKPYFWYEDKALRGLWSLSVKLE